MAGSPLFIAATISGCLLLGGLLTLISSLSQAARDNLRLPDKYGLWMGVGFTSAMILFTFVSGILVHYWGAANVFILGSLVGGFSIALLGQSRNSQMALAAAAAAGAATGLLHTSVALAMPDAFMGRANAPASTNFGYVFVILGCVATPYLSRSLVRQFGFRNGLLGLALFCIVPAALATLVGGSPHDSDPQTVNFALLLTQPQFWLAAVGVFFYHAVEVSAARWGAKYLNEVGYRERGQWLLVAAFWGIFLLARLYCATLEGRNLFIWVLLIAALLSAAVLGNMIGFHRKGSSTIAFLALPVSVGPVFPTMIGLALLTLNGQPNQQTAVALGLIFAFGNVGRLVAEPLVTRQLAKGETRFAMRMTLVMMLIVAIPALLMLIF